PTAAANQATPEPAAPSTAPRHHACVFRRPHTEPPSRWCSSTTPVIFPASTSSYRLRRTSHAGDLHGPSSSARTHNKLVHAAPPAGEHQLVLHSSRSGEHLTPPPILAPSSQLDLKQKTFTSFPAQAGTHRELTSRFLSPASRARSSDRFRDYHAKKFSGQGDPRIVDKWIQGLEFIFEVMDCPDRYRVVCAQLQLTGDARLWWNAYWSMRPDEKAGCTWDMLKELVREKYYPSYYRAEMERQFLSLQQGTRTVDEYEREFTRLAAF
ncbi:Unknown protein, partial [Striga hermonthica]